jgi:hypothetical protein
MPRFRIVPFSVPTYSLSLEAKDASDALRTIAELGYNDAHVSLNGCYSFSARRAGKDFWCIFKHDDASVEVGPERLH